MQLGCPPTLLCTTANWAWGGERWECCRGDHLLALQEMNQKLKFSKNGSCLTWKLQGNTWEPQQEGFSSDKAVLWPSNSCMGLGVTRLVFYFGNACKCVRWSCTPTCLGSQVCRVMLELVCVCRHGTVNEVSTTPCCALQDQSPSPKKMFTAELLKFPADVSLALEHISEIWRLLLQ